MDPLCLEAWEKLGIKFATSKDPRLKKRLEYFYSQNPVKTEGNIKGKLTEAYLRLLFVT
jgi:hypothetical protein